jgi:hypothetical protein
VRREDPAEVGHALDALKAPYTGDQWTASAIAERKVRLAYEGELETALAACTAPVIPAAR